jgi:hypothetical protein
MTATTNRLQRQRRAKSPQDRTRKEHPTHREGCGDDHVVEQFFQTSTRMPQMPTTLASNVTIRCDLLRNPNICGRKSEVPQPPEVQSRRLGAAAVGLPAISPRNYCGDRKRIVPNNAPTATSGVHLAVAGVGSPQEEETSPCQRHRFPLVFRKIIDESGLGVRSRATQMRAQDLLESYRAIRNEQINAIRSHCSMDMFDDRYDALDGAEAAVLYVGRPITDDDFRQPPNPNDFDSRFAEMMTLFLHHDLSGVVDGVNLTSSQSSGVIKNSNPRDQQVDYASLRYVSRQFLQEQVGTTEEAKKTSLYKSFRVAQEQKPVGKALASPSGRNLLDTSASELETSVATREPTQQTPLRMPLEEEAELSWQESDGSDSDGG